MAPTSRRFGKPVVRVVVVVREHGLPALDERRRHGLRADVHEPPLVKGVVGELHVAALDGVQDVLRPRYEQPHDRTLLLAHGAEDPFRLHALEQDGLAAHEEAAEPVHLRARVVQGRNAEEHIVLRLAVVGLLHLAGMHEAEVPEDDRLREAGRAGREIDRRVVHFLERDRRCLGRAVAHEVAVALREGRAVVAHVEPHPHARHAVGDLLHAPDELRPEHEHVRIGKLKAVLDLVRRVAEVERHGHAAGLQHAEVDRQPLKAVHQQDGDLVAPLESAAQEKIREAVRLLVELRPGDLAAERLKRARFDERILTPGGVPLLQFLRVDLDQRHIVWPFARIALQYLGYDFHGREL